VDHKCEKCLSPGDCATQCQAQVTPVEAQSLLYRLRKRAEIRRQIPGRLAVVENKPDRIADLLDESANEIAKLRNIVYNLTDDYK
jgi:hypothetical protein